MSKHGIRKSQKKPTPRSIVPTLLNWFAANARDLPWRRTLDPYAIWVSEIMLQQTQVKTVISYWERWMRELPTIGSLANAKPERIHKLWEGLGYYTRVRNMQKAAQQILAEHAGTFPRSFEAIHALPGIGRYTAGAIASIAFNQPTPILDGNVIRVLCRLYGIGDDPQDKKTNINLWQLAETLVTSAAENIDHEKRNSAKRIKSSGSQHTPLPCSALNQSLMELGALICTPRSPACSICPIARFCIARTQKRIDELPRPKQRASATEQRFIVFVIERGGRFLVCQRSIRVVNAHLWEFPNQEANGTSDPVELAQMHLGVQPSKAEQLCTIKHSITRYRIKSEAYRLDFNQKAKLKVSAGRWCTQKELAELAFTSAHRRIANHLL